ncbi:MAG TPA: FAD-dependent thymidylate synthase, partial [Nitrosopumilaceae archaeon]|nr:FAD-dependent thymidylate synthase [Nitrosopumilaceae archaeon]
APDGLATMIVMTTNHRNWRWLIEMRTSQYAEEEIRKVFVMIFDDLKSRYPNIYFDSIEEKINNIRSIKFNNSKV